MRTFQKIARNVPQIAGTVELLGQHPVSGSQAMAGFQSLCASRWNMLGGMSDVTQLLDAAATGDAKAAEELLPLVYDELRSLAATRLAAEKPRQTLQATALVHEAYLRLVDVARVQQWDSRWHFFAAAAEAMRRILVDRAREKGTMKRGGRLHRIDVDAIDLATTATPDQLLAVDEALARLSADDPIAGRIVELRYFAGLTVEETAQAVGISTATAYRHWNYARAWLHCELHVAVDS
jgi:RNA polymerase sigma factor (TIGR02999 family)